MIGLWSRDIYQMTHGLSGTWKYDDPTLKMSHEGAAWVWHYQPRVVLFPCPTNDCVSYVLSYDQLQEFWIICKRNAIESETRDRLPSKNAHSPNYCSWLAVYVNYSANFCCKIALINRFKLYLIKILTVTSKNKQNVNKNNVEYILRLHLVKVTWPLHGHPGWYYNVYYIKLT